jgi:hypothetical protein
MRRLALPAIVLSIGAVACFGPGQEFLGIWLSPSGERAGDDFRSDAGFTMATSRGAEHCNWESVIFLTVAWPPGSILHVGHDPESVRVFVRDPEEVYDFDRGGFSRDAVLPSDAAATGFTQGRWELWTSVEEDGYAFLVSGDRVERWPEGQEPACD